MSPNYRRIARPNPHTCHDHDHRRSQCAASTAYEKIWDHASGSLLVEESVGVITDSRGQSLDFGLG
ncbi:hypothetical protein L210DRAFT_979666 [Boletus edulis BED1]|uniref:Uncharacterized protein n=1 Tax=Boletus edulis BED1 TaxID=1328754 RepID=A0AAD4BBZ3_BOLED|nr:hypothetical protein L210DRAFT_3656399 [Boletus edulis BED1]KAF8452381.1 hypothetical protein L210DRAFT_979666 [Boletus edulis BED1]